MTRLPLVLSAADLPETELAAAALDGELFAVGAAYCALDELEGPALRLHAALLGRSSRLIAETRTAAWVWGAGDQPEPHEFSVTPEARARAGHAVGFPVRELVYRLGDLATFGAVRVTTPLRTILDLARSADRFEPDRVHALADIAGLGLDDCLNALDALPRVGARPAARDRLRTAWHGRSWSQAVETRYTS